MFENTFCSSPWFHTRINNSGHYEYCRFAIKNNRQDQPSIREQTPAQWFQREMSPVRQQILQGQELPGCAECKIMEQHGKISGRQKQLLKTGVTLQDFTKTMLSSPWLTTWKDTVHSNGDIDQLPQDWQIDLGNYCNSACVFCSPYSSSRLASEFQKLNILDQKPPMSWADDPMLLQVFLDTLAASPKIAYLHFIGGETMITPAFRIILKRLIEAQLSDKITIGFTTNLTVWDDEISSLLLRFQQVNLGISVECFHPLNDYLRYGSHIDTVRSLAERWISFAKEHEWLVQIRTTPTLFSIWHLDTVYDFASQFAVTVESCNFLNEPAFMRPSVLPMEWRLEVQHRLNCWIQSQPVISSTAPVINIRHRDFNDQQIVEDAASYVNYLRDQPDETHRLPALLNYLHIIERNRGNSILTYLPEYAKFLGPAGYQPPG